MNQIMGRETKERWRILLLKWKQIEQQALSELSYQQLHSPIKDALLKIRIRMLMARL